MQFKTLNKVKVKNRPVLVRIDINSEILNGTPSSPGRFKSSAETINFLKKKGAKIVCIAHQGQPKKGKFTSLRKHSKILNKHTNINFIPDITGIKAINAIKNLKSGEAILLENIRFLKDEYNPKMKNNQIIKKIVPLFDLYVNDAFSVSHRNQTSLVLAPYLPSAIGKTMEKELNNIKKIKKSNTLYILGGNKPSDLMPLLKNKKILTGGTLSILALMVQGFIPGKEKSVMKQDLHLIKKIKPYINNLILPSDLAIEINGKRKDLPLNKFPQPHLIFDIGLETIENYLKLIKKQGRNNAIFLKGTPGNTGVKGFELSMKIFLKALEKSKAFTIIAGGHTTNSLDRFKINKNKINYISLSGGALVHYISGKKLPGLEALKKCKKY